MPALSNSVQLTLNKDVSLCMWSAFVKSESKREESLPHVV